MARRKRYIDDDLDSDSSAGSEADDIPDNEDPDLRDERLQFSDPYNRKRRKRDGREAAALGVFGSDSEEEGTKSKSSKKRSDWAKAPAFIPSDKKVVDIMEPMDVDQSEGENDEDEDEEEDSDDSAPSSRPPSPRVREEDVDDEEPQARPSFGGGLGFGASKGGIGSGIGFKSGKGTGGIGFASASSSSGIGFSAATTKSTFEITSESLPTAAAAQPPPPPAPSIPPAFGSHTSSFVRETATPKPAALSANERAHFNKISGSFGARMLAKMGWEAGAGLGVNGAGIVTPVESKLRPQRAGIAFQGFKEKTEQSKMEARRRGDAVSDDETDPRARKAKRKEKEVKERRADAWKKPKKVKQKVEHKTYEQILEEAGETVPSGVGQIIDATGAVPREVASLADISLHSWTPSTDPTRIPEVRHNVRLIAEACKTDLEGLAREARALEQRKVHVTQEDLRLRKQVEQEAQLIARLQQVQIVATEISDKSKELASMYEVSLDPFSPLLYKLTSEYAYELKRYRLDEIVVAAIAPIVRRMVTQWDPLSDPSMFIPTFRNWRTVLRVSAEEEKPPETQVDIYGAATAPPPAIEKPMTPFESLLWNVWLPKVRTAINNDWSPQTPQPAVKLYEAWSTFLPPFIRDNMMDQLILPKVQKAVAEWNPRKNSVSLQAIVFPWLPHLGLRLEDVLGDSRRKVKSLLRSWAVGDPPPMDLKSWKEVFDSAEWDNMILKYVVPKLGATLRTDFSINPRNQNMKPFEQVLEWEGLVRQTILSQIFETEFFPKWLDILHIWLIQPTVSTGEVADWYRFWSERSFPESMRSWPGIRKGLTRGLQLMNNAVELGANAPTQLQKPDYRAELAQADAAARLGAKAMVSAKPLARRHEITFRSLVEEYVAEHNLLFMPTGKAHEKSRMPMFRVSPNADGKGGILVYILDDAVWAAEGVGAPDEDFRAISLENLVLRAQA